MLCIRIITFNRITDSNNSNNNIHNTQYNISYERIINLLKYLVIMNNEKKKLNYNNMLFTIGYLLLIIILNGGKYHCAYVLRNRNKIVSTKCKRISYHRYYNSS